MNVIQFSMGLNNNNKNVQKFVKVRTKDIDRLYFFALVFHINLNQLSSFISLSPLQTKLVDKSIL